MTKKRLKKLTKTLKQDDSVIFIYGGYLFVVEKRRDLGRLAEYNIDKYDTDNFCSHLDGGTYGGKPKAAIKFML